MLARKHVVIASLMLSCLMAWPFQGAAFITSAVVDDLSAGQVNQTASTTRTPPAWVARSNQNAQVLLEVIARFSPESAGQIGVEGFDEQVVDWKPGIAERSNRATREAAQVLKGRLASEKDEAVRQDLLILIKAAENNVRGSEIGERLDIPYFVPARTIFSGLRALLDDQVAAQRRQAATVRLRRYAGLEEGYTPLAVLAEQRTRERLNKPGLLWPVKVEVEKDLAGDRGEI